MSATAPSPLSPDPSPLATESLPSQYDHAAAQSRWYSWWEQQGLFHADPASDKPPFSIVIPPPNVTGALHLGHALNNTLQDILCRMKRMQGFNVLWMPGTDHAGIATQAVVERRLLEEEGKSRHDLGKTVAEARENLVNRIWQWKQQYEQRIIGQLKQLGCSCDWERTRFTLDDQCARAVRETFFKLFSDGKIYRGKRLVNWDTFLQTAVSDDEVFHEPVKGHFWHFKYPVIDPQPGEPTHVTIATTRPETMLGDTAVAVHPDPAAAFDKLSTELREKMLDAPAKEKGELEEQATLLLERRGQMLPHLEQLRDMALRGVQLELPLTGRTIPLIADEWAKPELGSGCVKITPAHDENDYQVWQRHPEIGAINIMNTDGTLNDSVPEKYRGLKMHTTARKAVVEDLEKAGLYNPETDRENREIDLAHSDRSKTPIEPYLADQWFVKMDELAQTAMDAVSDGRVKIIPERYAKTYLDWLSEKRDWPVGRQLWWGHRITVWKVSVISTGNLIEDRKKESRAFLGAWRAYCTAAGIEDDARIIAAENSDITFYVCARGSAIDELTQLHLRQQMVTESDLYALDSPSCPSLGDTDPRDKADHDLRMIAEIKEQDDEVLDTWFSSALWPHSTLGWPQQTPELAKFYPTSVLITSRDIITLWVARMVLTGLYNMGDIPFHRVFIHPKILDGYGETMSKSKGNGVDPLDVIDKFGADSLRFGLAYLTTETQDVRLPVEYECPHCNKLIEQTKKNRTLPRIECDKCGQPFGTQWSATHGTAEDQALPRGLVVSERFELGRNFCNKLWNASRFALMNLSDYIAVASCHGSAAGCDGYMEGEPEASAPGDLLLEDRWLLSRLATVTREVTEALENFRYADATRTLYGFAWDEFCSFYVEMTKARFAVPEQRATAQRVLAYALDTLLRLLHPITPFLTEEVWHLLAQVAPVRGLLKQGRAVESVCMAAWPVVEESWIDPTIEARFAKFQTVMGAVRNIRMEKNIPPKEPIQFSVRCDAATVKLLQPMEAYFQSMAGATATAWGPDVVPPEQVASKPLEGMEVHVDISAFFDVAAEKARLEKELSEKTKFVASIEAKLGNANFVSRAPAEVVQQQRDKLAEVREQRKVIEQALQKLG